MDNSRLRIELNNIRAIEHASISLSGISVITGVNGCGKSTISKLSYNLIKTSIEYDKLTDQFLKEEIYDIYKGIDLISREFSAFYGKVEYLKIRSYLKKSFQNISDYALTEIVRIISNTIDYLIKKFNEIQKYKSETEIRINRIKNIIKDLLPDDLKTNETKDYSVADYLKILNTYVLEFKEDSIDYKENRPIELLEDKLDEVFYDAPLNKTFNIYEYGVPIIDRKNNQLIPLHSFKNVAYIDTPMIFGIDYQATRLHWNELNELLLYKRIPPKKVKKIDDLLQNKVFEGNIILEEEPSDKLYTYKRNDGKEFDLLECATGLKSFAYLHILYKNGFLNNKTLLIIDEPEAHLHPQWVVEYARLVVLLNKYLDVKFLIASHHPDMISAIKYIYEKEQNNNNLKFYLAEKNDKTFQYKYKNLGLDIEPIFSSFNVALKQIDLYGNTEQVDL